MRSACQKITLFAVLAVVVSACKVGPDYVRPDIETPDFWHEDLVAGLERGDPNHETWWTVFEDPLLDDLMARAKEGNLDLKVAQARIRQARALRKFEVAGYYPDLDGVGSIRRGKTSESVQPIVPPNQSRTDNSYNLGFDAFWEIDVWGRISRGVESADASIQASIEDYRDTMVVLYAELAINYFEVRALQERIRYAEENVDTQKGSLTLTKDRFDAEIAPELDVRQAELNLASTESGIPRLRASLVARINRISVLLGENPGPLREEFAVSAEVPEPPDEVFIGIPANILRQRPDIRSAERRLAAQTARIGVATADLYPAFSLSGFLTQQTVGTTKDFFSGANSSWALVPGLRWNLFDGGRIRARIESEDALTEQALLAYQQTVLFALEEVEDSLSDFARERERRDALRRAVKAGERAVELARTLYKTGVTDFQNVLDMERQLAIQQDALASSEGVLAQNLVRIYKALGGGWSPDEPVEPVKEE
jgi:NodT family efflux transporter outer membrane factor (OMF) lipoprotein